MKKLSSAFFTVVFLLITFTIFSKPNFVNAETYGYLAYTILDGGAAITGCSTFVEGGVTIPSTLGGYPVTRIYGGAFINCTKVSSVHIPSSVIKIESGAFTSCRNLNGLWVDEDNPNYCSDQQGVLFNKEKTSLIRAPGSLTKYTIPDSVTHIESNAFNGCKNLSNVTIGSNVISIGASAFQECTNLISIKIPDSVKIIEENSFYRCSSLKNVIFGKSVTDIGNYAFNYCHSLTTISLPDSVINIDRAFNQCSNLTSIDIGNGVKNIVYRAFWGCSKLRSITIGAKVTRIQERAFEDCGSLIDVYYRGTESQWKQVYIEEYNYYLTERATIHYIHVHTYKNACDKTCDVCKETRNVEPHKYDNVCDENCNICDAKRTVKHTYKTTTTKATLTKSGSIVKKCTICDKTASKSTVYRPKTFKLAATSYTYDGKTKTPSITVKDSAGKTISSKYYTVKYASGRKYVGTYKVTVTFKGNYSGTKTLTFTINPPKTTVSKLSPAQKAMKVYITKKSSQVSGYQIQYATSKSFKSYKTKTVSSYKTTSATLSGLSAKKTYYVRVRTYKTVNGKKYYSGWSTYKYKKTK